MSTNILKREFAGKSSKITKIMKTDIVTNIVRHAIDADIKHSILLAKQLADLVYDQGITKSEKEVILSMPGKWLRESSVIKFFGQHKNHNRTLNFEIAFNGDITNFTNMTRLPLVIQSILISSISQVMSDIPPITRLLPKCMDAWQPLIDLSNNDDVTIKLNNIIKKISLLKHKTSTIVKNSNSIIDSVNTTKQLFEIWPAVEQFILMASDTETFQNKKLPSIMISSINELAGLPLISKDRKK